MQESVSMHKNPTPVSHSRMNQARSERQGRQRPEGRWKERQTNITKNTSEEVKNDITRDSQGQQHVKLSDTL